MSDGDLGAGRAHATSDGTRRLLLRDLVLHCEIGGRRQRVRVNLELSLREEHGDPGSGVSCDEIAAGIRRLADAGGAIKLAETLAERIAVLCLADARIRVARVEVEKPDADPDAAAIGIAIERINPMP